MRRLPLTMLASVLVLGMAAVGPAQEAAPGAPPATPPASDESLDMTGIDKILRGDQEVLQGDIFTYDPADRRDPFRSLLEGLQADDAEAAGPRPPGLPGMLVEELRLEGIIETPSGIVAFVQGRDNLSYIIRVGTKLYNGDVSEISAKRVVFRQQVNDPKQVRPYNEVVRELSD